MIKNYIFSKFYNQTSLHEKFGKIFSDISENTNLSKRHLNTLIEINSYKSNYKVLKNSEHIFDKSIQYWFSFIIFLFLKSVSNDWKMSKHFVWKLMQQELYFLPGNIFVRWLLKKRRTREKVKINKCWWREFVFDIYDINWNSLCDGRYTAKSGV